MVIYAIVIFIAILVGMAISVYAFGTGGKRKKIFQDIYFSIEDNDGVGVLYTKTGEYSAILRLTNPVQKFSANIDSYYEFTHLMTALAQTLGEGYAIHKQDIFIRKRFKDESGKLMSSFQNHTLTISRDVNTQTMRPISLLHRNPRKAVFSPMTVRNGAISL